MSAKGKIHGVAARSKGTTTREEEIVAEVRLLIGWAVTASSTLDLRGFERELLRRMWTIGRLLVSLFLETRETELRATLSGPRWLVERSVATMFGEVRVSRTYLRGDDGHGKAPLDRAVGLTADLVSANLLGLAALLATQMPFEHVREVLRLFVGYIPSANTIKEAVLGIGSFAQAWLEIAPIPKGDGEVLVTMFDSKGVPTATERELRKRRGKRKRRPKAASPRHRGRDRRSRWAPKRRRKAGDKSKNARLCTVVVMYTLQRRGSQLLGPLNKRLYVSFGPKELAFQWAHRQAARRGFGPDSGKRVQIVTDGDDDLATYRRRYFPKATHTLDVYHAFEYVWQAGTCLHSEGSPQLDRWYRGARNKVYGGKTAEILDELRTALARIPRTGPGNKGRRERLETALRYLTERLGMMNYKWLIDRDLEIGSGAAEGAVNHLVAIRFDHGGMRWIRERAQALLQLRCIHQNGDWNAFLDWALPQLTKPNDEHPIPRIQRNVPAPLPILAEVA
jgi:hypothetical protein